MAVSLGSIFFFLGAKTEGIEGGVERVKKKVTGLDKVIGRLGVVMAGVFSARAVIGVIKMGDEYNALQNRIKAATKETGDYLFVNDRLNEITRKTGSDLRTNVGLFQALSRAQGELAASNAEMLTLSESVGKLGAISGATGDELRFGLRQFTQGLSSGIFRAEEFNSILENIPELGFRIAKGMGVSVGELRRMVIEGKLMSKDVFDVLLKQTDTINKDFDAMDITVSRAFGAMVAQAQRALGIFLKQSGILGGIAKIFQSIANVVARMDLETIFFKAFFAVRRLWVEVKLLIDLYMFIYGFIFVKLRDAFISYLNIVIKGWNKIFKIVGKGISFLAESTLGALEDAGLADSKLATILKDREASIIALENERKERLAMNRAEEIAAQEQFGEKQKQIAIATQEEIAKRQALGAFFGTKVLEKGQKASLEAQAKGFRQQIAGAAQYSREFFALQKGLLLATALMEAPSAILSAYNFGAKIGGPFVGAAFGGIAAAAVGVQIGAIASSQFSGGRQVGGNVTPNRAFRVNEDGSPEVLTQGNQQFLLTGSQGGTVTPADQMGSTVNVSVNVVNTVQGATARVEKSQREDGGFDIQVLLEKADEFIAQGIASGEGATNNQLSRVFNLNRVAGAI